MYDYLYVYETCVTDKVIDNKKFICLDFTDLKDIEKHKHKEVIAFISIQTRYKMEKLGFSFKVDYNDNLYTTEFLISFFNKLTLTEDMVLLPYGAILNGLQGGEFFIRPNSGTKYFPGCTVKCDEIETFNQTYKIPNDMLCARSSTVDIISEKRCFLLTEEYKVLTESLYSHNTYNPDLTDFDVTEIVNNLCSITELCMLPKIVVADFALLSSGDIRLIEFNYCMTSGIYGCDMDKIIEFYETL